MASFPFQHAVGVVELDPLHYQFVGAVANAQVSFVGLCGRRRHHDTLVSGANDLELGVDHLKLQGFGTGTQDDVLVVRKHTIMTAFLMPARTVIPGHTLARYPALRRAVLNPETSS